MRNFIDDLRNNIDKNISEKTTVRTGEITAVNDDGTYDVKIAQSASAYPNIETIDYNAQFSEGEVVEIIFEYGNKESPKIVGTAKKIAQEPHEVEVDYSGDGGKQTVTTSIDFSYGGYIWTSNDVGDGNTTYTIAHDKTSGDDTDDTYLYIEQWYHDTNETYAISRGFLFFDTSSIPSDATITSAILYLKEDYSDGSSADSSTKIVIQNGQPNYPSNPLVVGDYNKNHYSNNGGEIITTDMTGGTSFDPITLNDNGKAWINKEGTTKLCLRMNHDIAAVFNGDQAFYWDIYTDTPYLTITYEY